jgi:hypothetical protein
MSPYRIRVLLGSKAPEALTGAFTTWGVADVAAVCRAAAGATVWATAGVVAAGFGAVATVGLGAVVGVGGGAGDEHPTNNAETTTGTIIGMRMTCSLSSE